MPKTRDRYLENKMIFLNNRFTVYQIVKIYTFTSTMLELRKYESNTIKQFSQL